MLVDIKVGNAQMFSIYLGYQLREPELNKWTQHPRVFRQLLGNIGKKLYLIVIERKQEGIRHSRKNL